MYLSISNTKRVVNPKFDYSIKLAIRKRESALLSSLPKHEIVEIINRHNFGPARLLGYEKSLVIRQSLNVTGMSAQQRYLDVVLKYPPRYQSCYGDEELVHEAIVGSTLSCLSVEIPNFVSVYGTTELGYSVPLADNNVIMDMGPKTRYLVYEYVDGPKLAKYIHKNWITPKQIVSLVLQILCAIDVAAQRYRFTHYDLHCSNIVLKFVPPTVLKYGNVEIHTNVIATIIDYEYSRIDLSDGTSVGVSDRFFDTFGISPNYHPLHDAWSIVCSCLIDLKPEEQEELGWLKEFFTTDSVCDVTCQGVCIIPQTEASKGYKHADLIAHILKHCPDATKLDLDQVKIKTKKQHTEKQFNTGMPDSIDIDETTPCETIFGYLDLCLEYSSTVVQKVDRFRKGQLDMPKDELVKEIQKLEFFMKKIADDFVYIDWLNDLDPRHKHRYLSRFPCKIEI